MADKLPWGRGEYIAAVSVVCMMLSIGFQFGGGLIDQGKKEAIVEKLSDRIADVAADVKAIEDDRRIGKSANDGRHLSTETRVTIVEQAAISTAKAVDRIERSQQLSVDRMESNYKSLSDKLEAVMREKRTQRANDLAGAKAALR